MAHSIEQRRKLELSTTHLDQQELLAQDIDENAFRVVIQNAVQTNVNIADRITAASVTRTIDGASTLEVTILDDKRELLNSELWHKKIDVQTEGLWWRLRQFNKQGDSLILTFEDREIAVLRTYERHIAPLNRSGITRAEFVLRMLKEVKEFSIPYYIPELHDPQPVFNQQGAIIYPDERAKGIGKNELLKITDPGGGNSRNANSFQITVANAILTVLDKAIPATHPHKRKIKVCAIMTAIVESQLTIPVGGDGHSQGTFQQTPPPWGVWPDSIDIVIQTNAFLEHAYKVDLKYPNLSYGDFCQKVQGSDFPKRYGLHLTEGQNFVNAFGTVGLDAEQPAAAFNAQRFQAATGGYFFYRGEPPSRKHQKWQPENTWSCITRLAGDVDWRAFFVSGTFYWLDEDQLFKSQPRAILSEKLDGVDSIDGDFDVNKKVASLEASVRMGKFVIPPGSVVKLEDMGPMNGRWLVSSITRDVFSPDGTINLKKPSPTLLEPQKGNLPKTLVQDNSFSGIKQVKQFDASTNVFSKGFISTLQTDAKAGASKIISYQKLGIYHDDRMGSQMEQWRLVAAGKGLTNRCSDDGKIFLDARVPQTIVFLIQNGWRIGTYAICSDHDCYVKNSNPPRKSAHPQGKAIDISSISPYPGYGFLSIGDSKNETMMLDWVPQVMLLLQQLNPYQVLCNGVAGSIVSKIQACQTNNHQQIDSAMDIVGDGSHTDHIHVGF